MNVDSYIRVECDDCGKTCSVFRVEEEEDVKFCPLCGESNIFVAEENAGED